MSHTNRPVTSREYKVLLNTERFLDRGDGIARYRKVLTYLAEQDNKFTVEHQDDLPFRRTTWYVDTPSFDLHRCGMALRIRDEEIDDKRHYKVTLKFRDPDRYISAHAPMDCRHKIKDGDDKFEEDITPAHSSDTSSSFASAFSRSVAFYADDKPDLKCIADAVDLFPGLAELNLPDSLHLQVANSFLAAETQYWIAKFRFRLSDDEGDDPKSDYVVKSCINFWSLSSDADEYPLVAEFSFDYDMPLGRNGERGAIDDEHKKGRLEEFPADVVAGANRLFRNLQRQTGWIAPMSMTKTAFAFEAF